MTLPPSVQPDILYLDETFLVLNKPAGLLSVPDGYQSSLPHLKSVLEPLYGPIFIVHRLDRDTSGVILVARTTQAHQELNRQFREREVKKIYRALICGCPPWQEFLAEFPLRANADRRHRTRVDFDRGQPATTEFRILQSCALAALLEASPRTGYTHQIRSHLAYCGFPIMADPLYTYQSQPPDPGWMPRLALHACQISFVHPLSRKLCSFAAPDPADFAAAAARLLEEETAH